MRPTSTSATHQEFRFRETLECQARLLRIDVQHLTDQRVRHSRASRSLHEQEPVSRLEIALLFHAHDPG